MAQDYDFVLKNLFQASGQHAVKQLAGGVVVRWLDNELPEPRNLQVDLLGETADGRFIHIEFQSTNSHSMGPRMLSYYAGIYQKFNRYPQQLVIYVGRERLRMTGVLQTPDLSFTYGVLDLRDVDAEPFLKSECLQDQMLAVLMRLTDSRAAIRSILRSIGMLGPDNRSEAIAQFLLISGLRNLELEIREEMQHVPIEESIFDHKVYGPPLRRAREEGREEGIALGETSLLRRLLISRFNELPDWAERRLHAASSTQIEDWSDRLLQAHSLTEVLGPEQPT